MSDTVSTANSINKPIILCLHVWLAVVAYFMKED